MAIHHLYLAGPDVFRPDAVAHGQSLVAQCARLGFTAVFPLNTALPAGLDSPLAVARHIYQANIAHLDRCDAVVANLDFFRGPEPDSGTCFEVGYAIARGKPVVGYLPDEGSFAQRIRQRFPHVAGDDGRDTQGWELEEFGLPLNLMLALPCRIVTGGLEAALAALREPIPAP